MATITHQIGLRIDSGATSRGYDLVRDIDDSTLAVTSTKFTDYASGSVSLPADGTPIQLSLGGLVDPRGLYLELAGGSGKVWLNADNVDATTPGALKLSPATPGAAAHLYLDVAFTSVWVASEDAATLRGVYGCWGYSRQQA